MTLPSNFQFSQSSLQDYHTCARRFQLRYVQNLRWPAVETAPVQEAERRMQLGSDFHRLVHQYILGLDESALLAQAQNDPDLAEMWQNFLNHQPPEMRHPKAQCFPEITLAMSLQGHRLVAKYDLLVFLPEQILIIDWKTTARRPTAETLRQRIQSRVYPLVLAEAGASLIGGKSYQPEQISLQYWFTSAPQAPHIFPYTPEQQAVDRAFLVNLLIQLKAERDFPLTQNQSACRFCVYRNYCDRQVQIAHLDEQIDDFELDELDLDWEHISEIAY